MRLIQNKVEKIGRDAGFQGTWYTDLEFIQP